MIHPTHNSSTNTNPDLSATPPRTQEESFLYLKDQHLHIIPATDTNTICQMQNSLRELLRYHLNRDGRKSLAERSIHNQQPLTKKTLFSFQNTLTKPRTKQALLDSFSQNIFISIENAPPLIRKDMEDKGILEMPKNILSLHHIMMHDSFEVRSLPLIKHLTTQCMNIDFDSSYETLEDEFNECVEIIFSTQSQELLHRTVDYVATLKILHDIWQHQDPFNWNKITLPPEAQPSLNDSPENLLPDQQHKGELLPIETVANPNVEIGVGVEVEVGVEVDVDADAKTKKPTKSAKNRAKKKAKAAAKSVLPHHDSPVTPSSEPSNSGSDKKTTEPLPSQLDQTPSKVKPIPESKPKTTLSKQTSSTSSQGARPKEATTLSPNPKPKPITNSQDGMDITSQEELNTLLLECCREVRDGFKKRLTDAKNFIAHPTDKALFKKARLSFNLGMWTQGSLYELLTQAHLVSNDDCFITERDFLIKHNAFASGIPPIDLKSKVRNMTRDNRNLSNLMCPPIRYRIIKDATPTEALDNCFKDFLIVDEGIIMELIIAKTLRYFWGDKTYNKHFTKNPFQLRSFVLSSKNPYLDFLETITTKRFTETNYTKGHVYTFQNHDIYSLRELDGEYVKIFAFCTNAEKPLFCVPEFFGNASASTIHKKLAELCNKKPHNEKLMNKESWDIFKKSFAKCLLRNASKQIKSVSEQDISKIQSDRTNDDSYYLSFTITNKIKNEYKSQVEETDSTEIHSENAKEDMNPDTEKTTQFTDTPSKEDILPTHNTHASGVIRKHSTDHAAPQQVLEEVSLYEYTPATIKMALNFETTNKPPHKKMEELVHTIMDTDIP